MNLLHDAAATAQSTVDAMLPPKRRAELHDQMRAFAVQNPRLAAFLALQTLLAGLPILFFVVFSLSVLAVSLFTCLLLAVVTAVACTLFTTGLALVFVLPTVFVGSCTASVIFVWGLAGYLVLQRFSGEPVKRDAAVDKLDGLTGGRPHGRAGHAHERVDPPSHGKAGQVHDHRAPGGGPHA